MVRRICVFSGSRADYGPLSALLKKLKDDPQIELRLMVSGGHLVQEQGFTVERILDDGFVVDERVEMVLAGSTDSAVAKSFGLGVIGYSDALDRIRPDILVVLGDRYEALAVSIVAAFRLLPVAHIAGGQVTSGSLDDPVRHSMTKFAQLHFASTSDSARRIIQLGEEPWRVHVVGALGLDTVREKSLIDGTQLLAELGVSAGAPLLLVVTYHPATATPESTYIGALGLLAALDSFPEATVVFTGTNVDGGGKRIGSLFADYVARRPERTVLCRSLERQQYLSLLAIADAVVGNSSSGLIEAPALHTATVNIGSRQDGRPRAISVVDCSESTTAIVDAIQVATGPHHRDLTRTARSPFGSGGSAEKIARILKEVELVELARKRFVDVDSAEGLTQV